jgi:hypothetical protein
LDQLVLLLIHKALITLAWVFLIGSLLPLVVLLIAAGGWVGGERATVFETTTAGRTISAWGLTYEGAAGSLLLWGELLLVAAALVIVGRTSNLLLRRASLIVLIAWAALIAANIWWLRLEARWDVLPAAPIWVTLGCACVLYMAAAWWRNPRPRAA